MRAKLLLRIPTAISIVSLSGCYPSFLTSRPEAEILVTDESGAPLEGAKVTLGTMERHGVGGRMTQADFLADSRGKVAFDQEYEWHTQVMLPDGDVSYSWSLCISKPGFEATPLNWIDFDQPVRVALYESPAASECEWQQYDFGPRVKAREARWIEVGDPQSPGLGRSTIEEQIRATMEASAREQGIKLHSWSEYRFQYQLIREASSRDSSYRIHAICRAPADVDLTQAFYSEPDESACFFDTTYTNQSYTDQPKPRFGPLTIVPGKG